MAIMQVGNAAAPPNDSSLSWQLGDIMWNNAPTANQPVGWICTTAGPGATANFTAFGKVGGVTAQTTTATSGTLSAGQSSIFLNPASTGTYSLPNVTSYPAGADLFIKNIASGSVTLTPLAANSYEATSIAAITLTQNQAVTLESAGTTVWYKRA
jgi:hypothetical protein